MTFNYLGDRVNDPASENLSQDKNFFEISIPNEAEFHLNETDWSKLKTIQRRHRFQRGEWEDFFVAGLKQSNKYCVFAFKDHYVNQANVRKRHAKMQDGQVMSTKMSSSDKKLFSASGYCVFEDCSIKFCLKMNDKLMVHVFYTGKIKHSSTEVNARHFRGKSREELRDILKNSTPTKEFLSRVCSSNIIAGNADYIGKSTSVYKKISAEAKDCYQSLIVLRDFYAEKWATKPLKGYIHLIQHVPGSIVCFNYEQCCIFGSAEKKHVFFISQFRKDLISTTIHSKNFQPYELSLCKEGSVVPLSCMLSTETCSRDCLTQWLGMFYRKAGYGKKIFNFVTDFSMNMVESVVEVFGLETYESYCRKFFNSEERLDQSMAVYVRVCQNQFLYQLDKILKEYYSFGTNYTFGMHAFSCLVNSENLGELEQALYSIMVILYNKNVNSLVENSFRYLKNKLGHYEKKENFFVFGTNRTHFVSGPEHFSPKFKADFIFCQFAEKVFQKCVQDSNNIKEHGIKNSRQSHKLLYNFVQNFSYAMPLWTRLAHGLQPTLSNQYTRFENMSKCFFNSEPVDSFIRKYEESNELAVLGEFAKRSKTNEPETSKSIIDILVNEQNVDQDGLGDSEPRLKNSKNELIKPKIVKKVKKDQNFESTCCFSLVSLNDADMDELEKEIVIERQHHIVSNEFGFELTKEDLDVFETGSLLNSNLIQFYLRLIRLGCSDSVFIYPLSFYPNLKYGFNESVELGEHFNLFKFELILVPIQKTDHWALAAIDLKNKKISYFDSMMVNDMDCLKILNEFIQKEYLKLNSEEFNCENWKNVVKQINLRDSGIFMLFYAKKLIQKEKLLVSEDQVEQFRNQVKKEIFDHVFKL
ncbi:sentrin-specific protease 1-like [Brachionus plicatilis]|uniref:Sentrin-specific protease 1-like n=1 Tax=Brachionus plicatilis TaxID=10195 RepID=A0A3M7RSQ2_BRAPC|nr:sentrin-specific protease 1-like [Brachionus plicatilis]